MDYHRTSGKVGVAIAHVTGGSLQMAGQLYNAQMAGSAVVVIAGDWTMEVQDFRGLTPFPGLSQAELMRGVTKEARCAYQVSYQPEGTYGRNSEGDAGGDEPTNGSRFYLGECESVPAGGP